MWALLHYLDNTPDHRLMFDLQLYLRSNWPATKELVEFTISKGWVSSEDRRTYAITPSGHVYLMDLRRVLEPLHGQEMGPFRRRLGEAIDYPK